MLTSGPSGFHNAPITKAIFLFSTGTSILFSVMSLQKHLNFPDLSSLLESYQIWRPFTHQLFFSSPGELLYGSIMIYEFRLFERLMGSSKFAGFTLVSVVVSILAQLAAFVLFPNLHNFTTGPYSFIFSCLVLYYFDIPVTSRIRLFGRVKASLKMFVYILAIQMMFSNFPTSFIAGFCGIMGGLLYRSESLGLKKLKFPSFINNFCAKFILPQLQSANRPRTFLNPTNGQPLSPSFSAFQQQQQRGQPIIPPIPTTPRPRAQPPSEESIQTLTSMGFPREAVVQALTSANGDLEVATNLLLES